MNVVSAARAAAGHRASGLVLWRLGRSGRSAAAALEAFPPPDLAQLERHPLCGGLVGAWLFTRSPAATEAS